MVYAGVVLCLRPCMALSAVLVAGDAALTLIARRW